MPRARRPAFLPFRCAFLALLLVGIVVRPLMGDVAMLHTAEHASETAAQVQAGVAIHDHHEAPAAVEGHGHQSADSDTLGTGDHATGAHAIMHYGGAGASMVALQIKLQVPAVVFRQALPPRAQAGTPRVFLTQPFRPPIA